jgi:hypothetical protein
VTELERDVEAVRAYLIRRISEKIAEGYSIESLEDHGDGSHSFCVHTDTLRRHFARKDLPDDERIPEGRVNQAIHYLLQGAGGVRGNSAFGGSSRSGIRFRRAAIFQAEFEARRRAHD